LDETTCPVTISTRATKFYTASLSAPAATRPQHQTSRIKDVLIVYGRNHYAKDIAPPVARVATYTVASAIP
jgi:hypothetical protein